MLDQKIEQVNASCVNVYCLFFRRERVEKRRNDNRFPTPAPTSPSASTPVFPSPTACFGPGVDACEVTRRRNARRARNALANARGSRGRPIFFFLLFTGEQSNTKSFFFFLLFLFAWPPKTKPPPAAVPHPPRYAFRAAIAIHGPRRCLCAVSTDAVAASTGDRLLQGRRWRARSKEKKIGTCFFFFFFSLLLFPTADFPSPTHARSAPSRPSPTTRARGTCQMYAVRDRNRGAERADRVSSAPRKMSL